MHSPLHEMDDQSPTAAEELEYGKPPGYSEYQDLLDFFLTTPAYQTVPVPQRKSTATRLWRNLQRVSRREIDGGLWSGMVDLPLSEGQTETLELFTFDRYSPQVGYEKKTLLNNTSLVRLFGSGNALNHIPFMRGGVGNSAQDYARFLQPEDISHSEEAVQGRLARFGNAIAALIRRRT